MSSPSKFEPPVLDREALEAERTRLEDLLALDEAWRALRQLEERLARGEATSDIDADTIKASLERELASNRLYSVYRDVVARLEAPAGAAESTATADEAVAFRTKVTVKPAGGAGERTGEAAVQDDLTRIRGLTRPIAERLKAIGVSRFETIANWTRADVDRISIALGIGRAIVRQSWVDQAVILMQTRPARDAVPVATPAAAPAVPVTAPSVAPPAVKPPVAAPPAPALPRPATPPPQAVLGTLVQRRSDQPVNEPLLSLQRSRAALPMAITPVAGTSTVKTTGPFAAASPPPSKPPKAVVAAEQPKPVTVAPPAGPVSAAARAAGIAANQAAPASAKAAPVAKPAPKSVTVTPAAKPTPATAATPVPAPAKAVAAAEKTSHYASRLDLIDGLDPGAIAALAKGGVTTAAQIAAFKSEEVWRWKRDLGAGLRAPFAHVIEQAAMLASGKLPAVARRSIEGPAVSLVPRPLPTDWGRPLLIERLRREAEDAARPKTPEEADRIARRSLREALAGGDAGRAAFATTMTTARTRLVDRLAMIDLPRRPRGAAEDVVAAFEERMAALQRELDEMERRLRADAVPKVDADAGAASRAAVVSASAAMAEPPAVEPSTAAKAAISPPSLVNPAAAASPAPAATADTAAVETSRPASAAPPPPAPPATLPPAPVPAATVQSGAAGKDDLPPRSQTVAVAATRAPEPGAAATAEPKDPEPEPVLGPGEADVVIVAKAPPPRPAAAPGTGPMVPPVVSAGSLAKRLRRFGSSEPIEADDYAAYHGEVEEAAVEIVRAPVLPTPPKSAGSGPAAAARPVSGDDGAAGERSSAIKRFVRALGGGP